MPGILTNIPLKEYSNVRFYPRQRYDRRLHRCQYALRDLNHLRFATYAGGNCGLALAVSRYDGGNNLSLSLRQN